jgi:hypothetical protein
VIAMPIFFAGGFAVVLILPVVLVLGILVILALRHDDDPDGNRAPAMYASVIAFLALLAMLFAATGVVSELLDITSGHTHASGSYGYAESVSGDELYGPGGPGGPGRRLTRSYSDDDDGAAATQAMAFFIAGMAALVLLFIHRRLFARRFTVTGAAARVHRAYLLVMCFTVALIGIAAAGAALFELYQVIFKDAANIENRADKLRELIPTAVLAVGAWSIWTWHWRELDLDLGAAPPPAATATDVP